MAHNVLPAQVAARTELPATGRPAAIPWYIWACAAAVTSSVIGGAWDISWHKSIGRDTFWTPAHIAIYLCGVLAGISCGYLILSTTFRSSSALREASVKIWGFRGPLGAFICAWGAIAMISSAPFDDWWHNAYGLDVKILSPPHVVLILGILAVRFGTLLLILGCMNRAQGGARGGLTALFLYIGAVIFTGSMGALQELTARVYMHSALFYRVVSMVAPMILIGVVRASEHRWASTILMGIYSALNLACIWILPLFPAEPKLGPVYRQVTHFIPQEFPLLLIVPAVIIDLLWTRMPGWNKWLQAAAAGAAFLAGFVAVQWPFAGFLMSPAARNWFFGTHYFPFFFPATSEYVRYVFSVVEKTTAEFWLGMATALVAAIVSTRLGLAWADWMRRLRR